MNQILVTQKLYVTPELKRKKTRYKILFFVSVFMICVLFSYYIYAEYDKNRAEEVSKYILADYVAVVPVEEDNTVRNVINDVLIVALEDDRTGSQNPTENGTEGVDNNSVNQNESEIQQMSEQTYIANDGTRYKAEAILNIPSLDINYPVLSETSDELLKISLNKYWGPNPNEIGNYCVVGHNYKNGKMFGKLSKVEIGDKIYLTDNRRHTVTYQIYNKYVVSPTDVRCTSQLTGGKREVTLITCTNYGTQRLVVKGTEV